MKLLSEDQLRGNEQAASVASSVLSEPVEAATRCEQITMDMKAEAAGVGGINRGLMRGMRSMNKISSVGRMGDGLETAGLPKSFIIAVTADQVHAIEDKQDDGELVPGKVLRTWDRAGFRAKLSPTMANMGSGVTDDRQVLILMLPIEGGNNRYLKAAAANTAAIGGKPYKFMIAKDAASQGVIDALVQANAVPNVMIGGTNVQELLARAGGAFAPGPYAPTTYVPVPDPTERLSKLAALRDSGALTDDEFDCQKAKILSAM
jgi:hypothetical protein